MGFALFIVGAVAIGLLILDRSFNLGLPIGLLRPFLVRLCRAAGAVDDGALRAPADRPRRRTAGALQPDAQRGVNFVWPIVERVAYTFDLREQADRRAGAGRDHEQRHGHHRRHSLLQDRQRQGRHLWRAGHPPRHHRYLAQTSMRSAIGSMELDKTFENRSEINERVVRAVSDAAQL
ncbi:MAG: hypothetical protein U1E25_10225 [Methylocystis sp.]